MPIGSILLVSALAFLVLFYLSIPFLTNASLGQEEGSKRSSLLAERERILAAVLELESDRELQKVPDDVFAIQRKTLIEKGAQVQKELDKFPQEEDSDEGLEELIQKHKRSKK